MVCVGGSGQEWVGLREWDSVWRSHEISIE